MYATYVPSGCYNCTCIGFSISIFIQQHVEIKIQYIHIFKGNNLLYLMKV